MGTTSTGTEAPPVTAEVITLDRRQVIKVKAGPYLVGYFRSVAELERAGVDLASLVMISR